LPDWAFDKLYVVLVAPPIAVPPKYHWYDVTAGRPEAVTVNWTLLPAVTVWLCGCVWMAGAIANSPTRTV
jgi:hypothetical protein